MRRYDRRGYAWRSGDYGDSRGCFHLFIRVACYMECLGAFSLFVFLAKCFCFGLLGNTLFAMIPIIRGLNI
jgi:hypothetical protein